MGIPKFRRTNLASRIAPLTPDEETTMFHRAIINSFGHQIQEYIPEYVEKFPQFEGVDFGRPVDIIRQWLVEAGQTRESYYFCNDHSMGFRATLALPLPLATYGVRGGYAAGPSVELAKAMCAYNAIDVLCAVGVPVFSDKEKQAAFVKFRRATEQLSGEEATCGPRALSPPGLRQLVSRRTTVAPPARDWDYVFSRQFLEWTAVEPVPEYAHPTLCDTLPLKCYKTLFGEDQKIVYHHFSSMMCRDGPSNDPVRMVFNACWIRAPLSATCSDDEEGQGGGPRKKHDELPLAMGRCVLKKPAMKECALHFLICCLRISALRKKFIDKEFVDEETLPKWFGRGDKLKENAKKIHDLLEESGQQIKILPTYMWDPQAEEEAREQGRVVGSTLFHSVGLTSRLFWDRVGERRVEEARKREERRRNR